MCIKQPTIAYFAEATTPNIPSKNSDADKNTGKSPDAHQNFSVLIMVIVATIIQNYPRE